MSAGTAVQDNAEQVLGLITNPMDSAYLGNLRQIAEPGRPARSNIITAGPGNLATGALAATGIGCFVVIPAKAGDVITKVSVPITATAGSVMTHQFAALYAGTGAEPALIEQSTDTTSAAIPASTLATWTLTKPVTLTEAQAPHGFIYAEICITATTVPTAVTTATPVIVHEYKWFANSPIAFSFTAGSALAGTAAAKIESATAKAVAPIIILY